MITVLTVETSGLGDRSYLAHDGVVALVVDSQRDHDRMLAAAEQAGVQITHVFESHVHNDYVTGGYQLARAVGAQYVLNAEDPVPFERVGVRDGVVVDVGAMRGANPAHTGAHPTHLSFAVDEEGGDPVAVFTGGSLLYGATGRPDLLGPDHTDTLAHGQWHSARRLATELPDTTEVYPTHGGRRHAAAQLPPATFENLAAAMNGGSPPAVLDVRRTGERGTGYIEGSVGIPIHEILDRIQDVPDGPVWVHCAGGYRAAIVAGLLDAHGHDVVAVDDAFTNARPAGLSLVASDAPTSPVGQLG